MVTNLLYHLENTIFTSSRYFELILLVLGEFSGFTHSKVDLALNELDFKVVGVLDE